MSVTSIWAIVPVKRLWQAKRRLSGVLTPPERAGLMWRMTRHLLITLAQVPAIEKTLVISSDAEVFTLAESLGILVLEEGEVLGLNTAVTRAAHFAASQGAGSALILPADLPILRPADVQEFVNQKDEFTICSDQLRDGTNALFLPLPTSFRFQYGPGSYHHHLQEAERLGMIPNIISIPGIQFDLDTEQDWQNYQTAIKNEPLAIGD